MPSNFLKKFKYFSALSHTGYTLPKEGSASKNCFLIQAEKKGENRGCQMKLKGSVQEEREEWGAFLLSVLLKCVSGSWGWIS